MYYKKTILKIRTIINVNNNICILTYQYTYLISIIKQTTTKIDVCNYFLN